MKKLFFTICFVMLSFSSLNAKVLEVLNKEQAPLLQQMNKKQDTTIKKKTLNELAEFITERIEKTVIVDEKEFRDEKKPIFIEPSDEAKAAKIESEKSAFQKIYEKAMDNANGTNNIKHPENDANNANNLADIQKQQKEWEQPNFPVINVLLPPNNTKALVPAKEHIPYLFTKIEILPTGMVKFDETIMVLSNGEKLKNGLTKVLPKYLYSRNGDKQKVDYSLIKVSINGDDVKYKLIEKDNQIMFVPEIDYELDSGVYTYNFQYVNNQTVWDYTDFREFYWDITGSAWNLVIARAGASITLPTNIQPLGQEVYVGYPQQLDDQLALVIQENANTWGYILKKPLFIGEGFHIVISLPKEAIITPTFDNMIVQKIYENGEIIFAGLGLLTILLSFIFSWKYIQKSKNKSKFSLRKNAIMLRYLAFNKYDSSSLVSFLLELYRKNIVDIQQADDTILLIKRTDNLGILSKYEKKALNQLFANNDAILNINNMNTLKIKRAYQILSYDLQSKLQGYLFKLNSGYLFFSWAMLLVSEFFIAFLFNNTLEIWGIMAVSSIVAASAMWLFDIKTNKKYINILNKIGAISIIVLVLLTMSAFIAPLAVLLILLSLFTIKAFTSTYSQRKGLLKGQIKEAQEFKKYLFDKRFDILIGKEILSQQANIVALGLIDDFISEDNNEFNKLSAAKSIIDKIN